MSSITSMSDEINTKLKIETLNKPIVMNTGEILLDRRIDKEEPKPWQEHKKNSLVLADLITSAIEQGYTGLLTDKRLKDLYECADALVFANYQDGSSRLARANFCRNRICPMCQWRRSLKTFGQVTQITEELLKRYPDTQFLFLTLTIKNVSKEDLTSTLDILNKGFLYLLGSKNKGKLKQLKEFKTKCLVGYIKAVEITYNHKDNTFHPHIHCILAVKKSYFNNNGFYISQSQWRMYWQKCLGVDYLPLVNVKKIKITTRFEYKAIAEISKYPCKPFLVLKLDFKIAIEVLQTFIKILHKRRFLSFSSLFQEIRKELRLQDVEDENTDLIHIDDEDEPKLNIVSYTLYKYKSAAGCYIC